MDRGAWRFRESDTTQRLSSNFLVVISSDHGGFPGGSGGKESACNAGDPGSIPGSGRFPGEGNSNPLQYSCLENPMDRGAWPVTVHRVAESDTTEQLTHTQKDQQVMKSPVYYLAFVSVLYSWGSEVTQPIDYSVRSFCTQINKTYSLP